MDEKMMIGYNHKGHNLNDVWECITCGTLIDSDEECFSNEDATEFQCYGCHLREQQKACIPVPSTPAKPEIKIKVCKGVVDNKEHIITVPVPSTPASVSLPPDELLTERDLQEFIEGTLVLAYMEGQANSNASATKLAKEIIAKCHQSEAHYEKKSRNQTIIIQECTKYIDDQKARIKELENRIIALQDHAVNLETSITNLTSRHSADIEQMESAIRAEQNRKIGEMLSPNRIANAKA